MAGTDTKRVALENSIFYVYEHIDPRTGLQFYVGGGSYQATRKRAYKRARAMGERNAAHMAIQQELRALGLRPEVVIYIDGLRSAVDGGYLEKLRIAELRAAGVELTNVYRGGESIGVKYAYDPSRMGTSRSAFLKGGAPNRYGFRGVEGELRSGKFCYSARIQKDGRTYGKGRFNTPYAAYVWYCQLSRELFGDAGFLIEDLPDERTFCDLKYGVNGPRIFAATHPKTPRHLNPVLIERARLRKEAHARKRADNPRPWEVLGMPRRTYEQRMEKYGCPDAPDLTAVRATRPVRSKLGVRGVSMCKNRYRVSLKYENEAYRAEFCTIEDATAAVNAKLVEWYGDMAVLQVAPVGLPKFRAYWKKGIRTPRQYIPTGRPRGRERGYSMSADTRRKISEGNKGKRKIRKVVVGGQLKLTF